MNVNVTNRIPNRPRGLQSESWWKNLGKKIPPGYFIPVNNGGRLKIIPGKPDPHGVWLVVNNRVILNGNKIANRKKIISSGTRAREKTLFQAWQNGNAAAARNMISNLTSLKMDQRVAVKQMINEIIRERKAAMKNANWKTKVGVGRTNEGVTLRHKMTIDFWQWISGQINTGRAATAAPLRAPRTNSSSPPRSKSRPRGRSGTRAARPPNAWNNN